MKLKEEFIKKEYYHSIFKKEDALKEKLFIEYLYDEEDDERIELYDIFISKHCDELFIVLKVDAENIKDVTAWWDHRVSLFTSFGSKDRDLLRRFKYNVIQLLLCKGEKQFIEEKETIVLPENMDRSEEGSLNITRKIILPYTEDEEGNIIIPDEEAVEIPFYMILSGDFRTDKNKTQELNKCLPSADHLQFLYKEVKKVNKGRKKITDKSFGKEKFKDIEEWLTNADSES